MIRTLMVATALATLASPAFAETITVAPGEDAQDRLQEALILAEPGDEIVLDGGFQLMLATSGTIQQGGHFHADGTYHEGEH